MKEKAFVTHKDPEDKFGALITYGDRDIPLPEDAIISITLGDRFSLWKTMVNGTVTEFIMKQMMKSPGLLYAELKGHLKEGYGLTLSVWDAKSMVPFRDHGAHKFGKFYDGGKLTRHSKRPIFHDESKTL